MAEPFQGRLLRDVEIEGEVLDCRIREGRVVEVGAGLVGSPEEPVTDGHRGALLPGLADHHIHVLATAAAASSLDLSRAPSDLVGELIGDAPADPTGWVRAVGYDEVRHGRLDRNALDRMRPEDPVRVQHRSGALWVLNSAALARLPWRHQPPDGLRTDDRGRPTGRLWRADTWLRTHLPPHTPDLAGLSERLAAYGITHLTDATPGPGIWRALDDARRSGDLLQHITTMSLDAQETGLVEVGPLKITAADHALPTLDDLVAAITRARDAGRAAAVHCVSPAPLALTLAALDISGSHPGDRVEHCAVADEAAAHALADRGLRVVTQPSFIARRGDDYLDRTDAAEQPDLWPYASLLRAGVTVSPSSDAPYGDPDPWATIAAATRRRAPSGRVVGDTERVDPRTALAGLLSAPEDPGGQPRRVTAGAPADLVLLDRPLEAALRSLTADMVRLTIIDGVDRYRKIQPPPRYSPDFF